jgi:hypothetical protein
MVVLSPAGRQVKAGEGEIRSIVKGCILVFQANTAVDRFPHCRYRLVPPELSPAGDQGIWYKTISRDREAPDKNA